MTTFWTSWTSLKRPLFVMAPLKNVTDPAFRRLVARCGKPDITWTEFVSADGLYHTREIQKIKDTENPLMRDLQFTEAERPIVAQIFSSKPEMIQYAAKLISRLGPDVGSRGPDQMRRGFDGIDLNMGCPDKSIEKQGAGAALIKNPALAKELILAAKEAVRNLPKDAYRSDLVYPISIKTRIGYNSEMLEEWLAALLGAKPAAITLHLRTRKEMSKVPADWEQMKKAITLRNKLAPEVLLIGNGDVMNLEEGKRLAADTGCDGIMIGRGIFGNPWLFDGLQGHRMSSVEVGHPMSKHGLNEKLNALVELAHDFEKLSPPKHFAILKKHIKAFVTGFDGAAELRAKMMEANSADELATIVRALVPKA